MKTIIILLYLAMSFLPIHARIGETPVECQTRYGNSVAVNGNMAAFLKAGLKVIGIFDGPNNTCSFISISKIETDVLGNSEELTDVEINALLSANGGKKKWKKVDVGFRASKWLTEDGLILAEYDTLENELIIYTREKRDRNEKEAKDEQEKNLEGF